MLWEKGKPLLHSIKQFKPITRKRLFLEKGYLRLRFKRTSFTAYQTNTLNAHCLRGRREPWLMKRSRSDQSDLRILAHSGINPKKEWCAKCLLIDVYYFYFHSIPSIPLQLNGSSSVSAALAGTVHTHLQKQLFPCVFVFSSSTPKMFTLTCAIQKSSFLWVSVSQSVNQVKGLLSSTLVCILDLAQILWWGGGKTPKVAQA